jgi:predicted amidohydrolase
LRIAVAQIDVRPGDVERNLASMERLARQAAAEGAQVVLFPEGSLVDYHEDVRALAEPYPDGPSTSRMAALARDLGLAIGFGLPERSGDLVYLSHAFVDADGPIAVARKTALFASPRDELRDEPRWFEPGSGPVAFELAGLRAVALLCNDGEVEDVVSRAGALAPELVLFPNNRSNLPEPSAFATLARELGAPVVLANRVGLSHQYDCNGGSCVLAADGSILAAANRRGREELIVVDVPVARAEGR